jgi:hypothetical protein
MIECRICKLLVATCEEEMAQPEDMCWDCYAIIHGGEETDCECEIPTMEEAIFRECEGCLERYDMAVVNGRVVNNNGEVMK